MFGDVYVQVFDKFFKEIGCTFIIKKIKRIRTK